MLLVTVALSTWPSMLAGQHSTMLSGTACTWNIKGVVSDFFHENTRYFKDILKRERDIYISIYLFLLYGDRSKGPCKEF